MTDYEQAQRLINLAQEGELQPIIEALIDDGYAASMDHVNVDRLLTNHWGEHCKRVMTDSGLQGDNISAIGLFCKNASIGSLAILYNNERMDSQEALGILRAYCDQV